MSNPDTWVEAHMRIAEKWDGRMPGVGAAGGDWKLRARRAEAEAAVNMAIAASHQLKGDARVMQLRHQIEVMETSLSWRLTAPLRRVNHWLRRLTGRVEEGTSPRLEGPYTEPEQ